MALLLGIDTGGTFTDAVLYDESVGAVVAKAKAPTTHHDLTIGIRGAIERVLEDGSVDPAAVEMIGVSTTLATNALVEGQGEPVALVFIGFPEADLDRASLRDALDGDPALVIAGGHTVHGSEAADLDVAALKARVAEVDGAVCAYAVAAQFAVRNPAHEIMARDLIRAIADKPVTCSHDLSARLGGPQRALTTVLNARLIGLIDRLIEGTGSIADDLGFSAPIMVVRGDGTLMSADLARQRPIETILSGPAASVIGAAHLAGVNEAFVSDIGGTTTDIAILTDGAPALNAEGARVGGWQTLVEAIDIRTHGIGGDSHVSIAHEGSNWTLTLGPQRAIPVTVLAARFGESVVAALDRQSRRQRPDERDGVFVVPVAGRDRGLDDPARALLARLDGDFATLEAVTPSRRDRAIIDRLVRRGIVRLSAFTPTDAAVLLGLHGGYDAGVAEKSAKLLARQKDRLGNPVFADGVAAANHVLKTLVSHSAQVLLEAGFAADGFDPRTARFPLTEAGIAGHKGAVAVSVALNRPVIGVGASAPVYYPRIATHLNTDAIVPDDADVANALGAVVGRVTVRRFLTIVPDEAGLFHVTHGDGQQSFSDPDKALEAARTALHGALLVEADAMGAENPVVAVKAEARQVEIEGRTMTVELSISGKASGRPRHAHVDAHVDHADKL